MTPTPEQISIIELARSSKESILVNALAGAAKTTTIEMICHALPVAPILCLAFNKRIQVEMEKRLPGHVKCQTLNSLGHGVWARTCTKRIVLKSSKSYDIIKSFLDVEKRGDRNEAWSRYAEVAQCIRNAKMLGYIPEGKFPLGKPLVTHEEFWATHEEEPDNWLMEITDNVMVESIKQGYGGLIDYDDQIYLPTLFGGSFPRFPLVMVDEAQDLSKINHAMLDKLVVERLIAVGDPYQSIYGFRGAVHEGMDSLRSRFNMTERGLSISFRCPIEVVKLARFRAPHMQWPEWAKEGSVTFAETWSSQEIPDGAAIICRNNAPLFKCALHLLRSGRGVQLVGSDLGPGLIKVLKSLGSEDMSSDATLAAIDQWEVEKLRKARAKAATKDKAECLRVFAAFGSSLGAAIAYAENLFKSQGPIFLLSGHKAKGGEWDSVYHLDPWRIPSQYAISPEELEQEKNLSYVITTRAKSILHHVNLETLDAQ